jgi:hypothetical protein
MENLMLFNGHCYGRSVSLAQRIPNAREASFEGINGSREGFL